MNETKLLEARVAEVNARRDLWLAIADAIKTGLAMAKEAHEASSGNHPERRSQRR